MGGRELVQCCLVESRLRTIHPPRALTDEMCCQRRYVLAAFPQRWNFDRKNAQTIEKILAEATLVDPRTTNPNVYAAGDVAFPEKRGLFLPAEAGSTESSAWGANQPGFN